MATLEHLDLVIGEALENINEASREVKKIGIINSKEMLKHLGRATLELWETRESIYQLKPDLKRDFVREYEDDKLRYEQLHEIMERAHQAEEASDIETAVTLFEQLRQTSRFGFFRMVAEAALYRLSKASQ